MEDIVSNVCSLCAMVSDSISGTKKNHKQILGFQMISMVFLCHRIYYLKRL